jgi:hypothetical protein
MAAKIDLLDPLSMKGCVLSSLARQPDGKGYSLLQEHMWQACALALATHTCGKAEFEAALRRLVKSCRTFCTHPCSKNYFHTVQGTMAHAVNAMN